MNAEALRKHFNENFTLEKYHEYVKALNDEFNYEIEFRIAETPVFVSKKLKNRILQACEEIVSVILKPDYKELTNRAIPSGLNVPNETAHTEFLAIDFAICADENGDLLPQLIELQGFPSLYGFQEVISQAAKKHFYIPENFDYLFSGLHSQEYLDLLKKTILGNYAKENVILLEVEPEKQKTKVDFYATERYTGVKAVCITEIVKEGKDLFYFLDGKKTPIYRMYNRVIFDELEKRTDLNLGFHPCDEINAEWAGHPNWFFRISKFTLPFLKSTFVPETKFLSDYNGKFPADLENYVLKPLFSFAGTGVIYDVKPSDLDTVTDPENYILMKKVFYAPALPSPEGPIKTEIRMLFLWPKEDEKPTLATSLVRLSQGVMMGVKFNKDKTWVGGSVAYFEKD